MSIKTKLQMMVFFFLLALSGIMVVIQAYKAISSGEERLARYEEKLLADKKTLPKRCSPGPSRHLLRWFI